MNLISDLLLALWPMLIILGTAGWGVAVQQVLRIKNGEDIQDNLFNCSFKGIFLVSFGVLLINFWSGLGLNAGLWVVGIGLFFYTIALWNQRHWAQQTLLLFVIMALTSRVYRYMWLTWDAGHYHIPYMNWVADGPVPYGIANLNSRFGFNSAWLLFVSGLRVDSLFAYRHVVHAEIAIRALAITWLVWQFIGELKSQRRWSIRAYLYLSVFIVLELALNGRFGERITEIGISTTGHSTSTDHPANICALLAWVVFSEQLLVQREPQRGQIRSQFGLMMTLATLAVSFKLSMLPIILLPLFYLWRHGLHSCQQILKVAWPMISILCMFVVSWMVRSFIMSGCLLYPVALSCFSESWAVPTNIVDEESRVVLTWARYPGTGEKYKELLNLDWLGDWSKKFVRSNVFLISAAGIVFCLLTTLFIKRRENDQSYAIMHFHFWALCTFSTAFGGILLWFVKAPDPRFAWGFFVIFSAALILLSLLSQNRWLPAVRIPVLTPLQVLLVYVLPVAAAFLLVITLGWKPLIPLEPQAEIVVSKNGWKAFRPSNTKGKCWALFPCSPYDIDHLDVRKVGDRWRFQNTQGVKPDN
ncbi:MAG: hypothetical protein ABIU05_23205 [Nitrospirales bacterium]